MMLKTLAGRLARRPWRFVFPGLLLFFFAYTLSHRRGSHPQPPVHKAKTKSFFPPLETRAANSIELDYCHNFPVKLLEEIQVVLKVASDGGSETKAHLSTVSSCITNLIIVGDREERLGDRKVIDVLAELPKSYEKDNLDFQAYVEQKKAHTEGETVKEQQRSFKLDRFKYLPMVDKAYIANPTAKWFVFLESDVYFFWDTLFRLLSQLDASEPHYLGEAHKGSEGRHFAYGGAGIVLSQGLMKQLIPAKTLVSTEIPRENRLAVRYESWVKEEQRGDAVLAYAIQNATGRKLEAMYPTFASDKLKDVTTTRDKWCVPMLSLHQLKPQQMEDLWKWERTRPYNTVSPHHPARRHCTLIPRLQKPFTYSSFLSYTHGFLSQGPSREWWDNLSFAPVPNDRPAHRNAGSCGSECAIDNNCLQWSYSQTVCRHADFIKLGDAVDRENGGQGEFVSGWDAGKLRGMGFGVEDQNGHREFYEGCLEATWLSPQIR
jgi:hypothetical protein